MYNVNDLLNLDIFGKNNASVEGSDGDFCFQADETSEDQQQASVFATDTPPPSSTRDEKRNIRVYVDIKHAMRVAHKILSSRAQQMQCYLQQLLLTESANSFGFPMIKRVQRC